MIVFFILNDNYEISYDLIYCEGQALYSVETDMKDGNTKSKQDEDEKQRSWKQTTLFWL